MRLARYVQDLVEGFARKMLARFAYFLQDGFYWVSNKGDTNNFPTKGFQLNSWIQSMALKIAVCYCFNLVHFKPESRLLCEFHKIHRVILVIPWPLTRLDFNNVYKLYIQYSSDVTLSSCASNLLALSSNILELI